MQFIKYLSSAFRFYGYVLAGRMNPRFEEMAPLAASKGGFSLLVELSTQSEFFMKIRNETCS